MLEFIFGVCCGIGVSIWYSSKSKKINAEKEARDKRKLWLTLLSQSFGRDE